ncbi:hypothetical protein C4D60_Mb11t21280 [Musa balbisiana]|uniref:Uncharacterized protein n=1 Tax=Musa balbisiana TaxID=52838 RepID=A0A4S8J5Z5_MUSBA|nr:hypothetical protein C4D60_Mb11t21280 [Musa balbisiana]
MALFWNAEDGGHARESPGGGVGEACCSLAAVESGSFCGSKTLWCCTQSHEMDTFYLSMSPYCGLQPKGIYELRAVRSMQRTDIWDEYSSLDARCAAML